VGPIPKQGYLTGVSILDQSGNRSTNYLPSAFTPYLNSNRNSLTSLLFTDLDKKFNYQYLWMFDAEKDY
jgi:hypothetical protein